LKSYEIQFSPDEKYDSVSVRIKSSTPEAIIKANAWKKVLLSPGNTGGILYWRVVGTRSDRTTATSDIHSIIIGPPQPVRNADLSEPGQGSLPALSWENNCNIKFKVWFRSNDSFSKRTTFAFILKNPNDNGGVFAKTLTPGQWAVVKNLVRNALDQNIYWYVESWDASGRHSQTEVMSFVLME